MRKLFLFIIMVSLAGIFGIMSYMVWIQRTAYAGVDYTPAQAAELWAHRERVATELADLPQISNAEYKAKVNATIGYSAYIETDLPALVGAKNSGRCHPYLTVALDGGLSGAEYGAVLLHELVHLVYWYTDERKTEFTAFRLAYESTDPYMNLAANQILTWSIARALPDRYNIVGNAIEYLGLKGGVA